jgi:RNA polymerase sigma-70 factor (ECF subfamily)
MHERAVTLPGRFVTDDATAADALSGEFEARLVECAPLAFRVAYGVLRHREDAEDAAQEAFTRAYRSFSQLRDRDRFRTWIVRTTWRVAINRYHEKKRRGGREVAAEIEAVSPDSADAAERAGRLWRAIDVLPEKLRITVILAGIEGHNIREVAGLLDVPEGTVKSRLFDARQRLKELLS